MINTTATSGNIGQKEKSKGGLFVEELSLRDYFAAKALPACYAETCRESENSGWLENWKMGVALDAYAIADAMLEARKK